MSYVTETDKVFSGAFEKGSQHGWQHDEGDSYGYFHTYDSFTTGVASRKIHILLPREYDKHLTQHYPVIYVQDGNTVFWQGGVFGKSWNMQKLLSSTRKDNLNLKSFILVAILPIDRAYEYTHGYCCNDCGQKFGGIKSYAHYVAHSIKPFIDSNYRTLSDSKHTFAFGSSHGATAAYWLSALYPDLFGNAICFSPSFTLGIDVNFQHDDSKTLINSKLQLDSDKALSDRLKKPNLYIHWGLKRNGGIHNEHIERIITIRAKEFATILQDHYNYKLNENLYLHEDKHGGHEEDDWSRHFLSALSKFSPLTT